LLYDFANELLELIPAIEKYGHSQFFSMTLGHASTCSQVTLS